MRHQVALVNTIFFGRTHNEQSLNKELPHLCGIKRSKMKTITEIKQHFSDEEIKLLIEIINGRQEFSVMENTIRDFYGDEYNEEELKEKLEFDFEYWRLI